VYQYLSLFLPVDIRVHVPTAAEIDACQHRPSVTRVTSRQADAAFKAKDWAAAAAGYLARAGEAAGEVASWCHYRRSMCHVKLGAQVRPAGAALRSGSSVPAAAARPAVLASRHLGIGDRALPRPRPSAPWRTRCLTRQRRGPRPAATARTASCRCQRGPGAALFSQLTLN
jgi:hypothetical protein